MINKIKEKLSKNTNSKDHFLFFNNWKQLFIFYFMGLSIFFIAGFTIINIRVSQKEMITVPALVGKLYIEEHNKIENLGF